MNTYPTCCLVSACLTGLPTRYDGKSKPDPLCQQHLQKHIWIPVCPEQLGGLTTPRLPANLTGGDGHDVLQGKARVIRSDGEDVTTAFIQGANMVLNIAQQQNIQYCLLKSKSPSCGAGAVLGVTAALLRRHGISVIEYG
ncbi:DUF523 domain-containing protein [Desulfogranum japonicum]|uniref:DUF523 domain-containing protein n=1 Tax=Desulfogranum japonicum TaxID=231447 RepID=UPI000556B57E|nr:DUF523 domain-containing protein [Desulfogranum japonicum]